MFFVNYTVVNFSPIWRALCLARSLTCARKRPR
nr:MAG TPA: hypothetical protein [Caudoviricetes sp.]